MNNPLQAPMQAAQQQVQQLLAQLRAQLDQRTPRERVLLLGGGGVLLVMSLYLGIWEPMRAAHAQRSEALQSARSLAIRIETAAALAQSQGGQVNRQISILAAVDQAAQSMNLGQAPSRVQPDGNGDKSVKVWFEEASFDNLLRWLAELQTRYGIQVASAEFEHGNAPGAVSARISLSR